MAVSTSKVGLWFEGEVRPELRGKVMLWRFVSVLRAKGFTPISWSTSSK